MNFNLALKVEAVTAMPEILLCLVIAAGSISCSSSRGQMLLEMSDSELAQFNATLPDHLQAMTSQSSTLSIIGTSFWK